MQESEQSNSNEPEKVAMDSRQEPEGHQGRSRLVTTGHNQIQIKLRNDNDFALNDKNKDLVNDLFKNQQQTKSGRAQGDHSARGNDQKMLPRKRMSRSNKHGSKQNQASTTSKQNRDTDSMVAHALQLQQKDNSSDQLLKNHEMIKLADQKKVSITHMPSPRAGAAVLCAAKFQKRNTDSLVKRVNSDTSKKSEIRMTNQMQKQFVIISAKPSNESIPNKQNDRYMDRDLVQPSFERGPGYNNIHVHMGSDYVERAAYSQYSPRQLNPIRQTDAGQPSAINRALNNRPSLQVNLPMPKCVAKNLLTPGQHTSNTISNVFSSVASGSIAGTGIDDGRQSGRNFMYPYNASHQSNAFSSSPNRQSWQRSTIYSYANGQRQKTRSPSNYQQQMNQAKQLLGHPNATYQMQGQDGTSRKIARNALQVPADLMLDQFQLYMAPPSQRLTAHQPNPLFRHLPGSSLSDPQGQQYLNFAPTDLSGQIRKPKKSTIEHATASLPQSETAGMLKVGGLSQHLNRTAHLKLMRGQLDKMKEYAREKFGYPEQYLKPHPIPKKPLDDAQAASTGDEDRLETTTAYAQKHSRLIGNRKSPSDYRFSQQDQHPMVHMNGDILTLQSKFHSSTRKNRTSGLGNYNINSFRNNQLYIDSQNVHTDMAAGPDSPGITSLEFGGRGLGNDGLRSALDKNDLQSEEFAGHSDAMNETFFMKNTNTISGQKDITRQLDEKDDTTDGLLSSITGNFPKSPGISGGMLTHKKDSFNIKTHLKINNEDQASASQNRERHQPSAFNPRQNHDGMRQGASGRVDQNQAGDDQRSRRKNQILDSAIQNTEFNANQNPMSEEFTPKTSNEAKFTIFHFEATQQSNLRHTQRENSSYLKSPPTPGDVSTPMSPHIHGQGPKPSSFEQQVLQQSQIIQSSDYQDQLKQTRTRGKEYVLQNQPNPRQRSVQGKKAESVIQMKQMDQGREHGTAGDHREESDLAKSQNADKSKSNQVSRDSQKGSKFSKQKIPNIEEIISHSQLQYQKQQQHNQDKGDASSAGDFQQFQSPVDSHSGNNMMINGGRPRSQFDGGKGGAQSNLQKATFPKNLMHQANNKASNQNQLQQVTDYMVISSPEVKFPLLDMANVHKQRNQTLTNSQARGKESNLNDKTPGTSGTIAAATDTMADIVKHYVNTSNDNAQRHRQKHHNHLDHQAVQIKYNEKAPQVSTINQLDQKFLKTQQYDTKLGGWLKLDQKYEIAKLPIVRFSEDVNEQAQLQAALAHHQPMTIRHQMAISQKSGSNSLSNAPPIDQTLNSQMHHAQRSGQTSLESSKSPTTMSRNWRLALSSKLDQKHRHRPEDSLIDKISASTLGKKSKIKPSILTSETPSSKIKHKSPPYMSKEAKRLNEFRQIAFPTRKNPILPQKQPGKISFTSKEDTNPLMYIDSGYKGSIEDLATLDLAQVLDDSCGDFRLSHREKIKLIKHENMKQKNLDDQHKWKLLQQHPILKKGLKAELSKERQMLLRSFLENQKKNKIRTLSTGNGLSALSGQGSQQSAFVHHGATYAEYEKSIESSRRQFGSTISHGINFAKLKSSSISNDTQTQGIQNNIAGKTIHLKQGENIKERLACGILNNSSQYPQFANTVNTAAQGNLQLYYGHPAAANASPWQLSNTMYLNGRIPTQLLAGGAYAISPAALNTASGSHMYLNQDFSKTFQLTQQQMLGQSDYFNAVGAAPERPADQIGHDEALYGNQALQRTIDEDIRNFGSSQQKILYADFDKNAIPGPLDRSYIEMGQRQLSVENVPNQYGTRQSEGLQLTLGHPLSDGINSAVASLKGPGTRITKKALGVSGSADDYIMPQMVNDKKTEQTFVAATTNKQSGNSHFNSGMMSIDQNSSSLGRQIILYDANGATRTQPTQGGAPTPKTITQTQAEIMNKYQNDKQ